MDTSAPQPTKVGRFTLWVILALVAIVVIALVLAFTREDGGAGQPPEPVRDTGVSMATMPPLPAA